MTNNNSTTNHPAPVNNSTAGKICNLAASLVDLFDVAIDDPEAVKAAQLVAMRALAGNIGALADHAGGGGYRGDSPEWLGVGER